jgi:hypothetical protein
MMVIQLINHKMVARTDQAAAISLLKCRDGLTLQKELIHYCSKVSLQGAKKSNLIEISTISLNAQLNQIKHKNILNAKKIF